MNNSHVSCVTTVEMFAQNVLHIGRVKKKREKQSISLKKRDKHTLITFCEYLFQREREKKERECEFLCVFVCA